MLYYAALMNEDDNKTVEDAKVDAFLKKYVEQWGKPDDLGFIAVIDQKPVGAVWIRHFEDEEYESDSEILETLLSRKLTV